MFRFWWKQFKVEMFILGLLAFVGILLSAFDKENSA